MLLTKTNIEKYYFFHSPTLMFTGFLDDFQCLSDFDKSSYCFIEMFLRMSGRKLNANTGFFAGNNRVEKPDNIYAFFESLIGHGLR